MKRFELHECLIRQKIVKRTQRLIKSFFSQVLLMMKQRSCVDNLHELVRCVIVCVRVCACMRVRGTLFIFPIAINISCVVQHTTFSAHIRLPQHLFST